MARRLRRRITALGASVVVLGVLSACAQPVPTVSPSATPATPGPDLTVAQQNAVLSKVTSAVKEADKARDVSKLSSRMTEPGLSAREAQYKVAKGTNSDDLVTSLVMSPSSVQQVVVPTTTTWGRSMYVIPTAQAKLTPTLAILDQASPHDDYKIWSWVKILPGTSMPSFSNRTSGSAAVAPDDKSLKQTPSDAVSQYVDVLNLGSKSGFASSFPSTDGFRKGLADRTNSLSAEAKKANGSYVETFALTPGQPIHSVRTVDGGAMVVAALTASGKATVDPKATVTLTPALKALRGTDTFTGSFVITSSATVALYVPPKNDKTGTKITPLGYEYVPLSVSRL